MSCKCESKFDSKKCNSNQKWNSNKCQCVRKKIMFGIPQQVAAKNGKYIGSIIGDPLIMCDEIIKETKKYSNKNQTIPRKNTSTVFYILLAFLLIIIALVIAVTISCCFIKNQVKERPFLPCHYTIGKIKETSY